MGALELEQNSEEWLKFRGNSIGSSEIASILEISPWKKRAVLLREKAFPFPKDLNAKSDKDFIFAKGHSYEKKIRNFVEFDLDLSFTTPTVVLENPKYETPLHASLDGISQCLKILIECKFVGFEAFETYKKSKKPPEHYLVQIQQALLITGAEKCLFAFCREIKGTDKSGKPTLELEYHYFDVLPDRKMQEKILVEAAKFWKEVLELRASGPKKIDENELDSLLALYEQNEKTIDLLTGSQQTIKEKIFKIVGKEKVIRGECTVQTVISKGRETVDYKSFVTDKELVIPKHYYKTGAASESQRITFKKEKKETE